MSRILITLGDPAGIGPEVIARALASGQRPAGFDYVVLGDRHAGTPGHPDARSAAAALAALDEAVQEMKQGRAAAVVTGPVSKEGLQAIGFPFPGQTEYFAHAFGVEHFGMLLTGATLTVGLATIHEPLAKVPELLTIERIMRIGSLTAGFLQRRGLAQPRIAVAGLNPHAGENGLFGDEEEKFISPAIAEARRLGLDASGPYPGDTIFFRAHRGEFDGAVAMYHDQGHVAAKMLGIWLGVNVTLGLPIIRTSVEHGTNFDMAGTGKSDPRSLLAAIKLAATMARNRASASA